MDDIYARRVKEQNNDLKTKNDKGVNVEMTDKEYNRMTLLALKVGFKSPGELLERFVGDLSGWHINGSDESDLADKWLDRAFGIWSDTRLFFRYFLYDNDINIKPLLKNKDFFNQLYDDYLNEENNKEHDSKEECLAIIKELQRKSVSPKMK